MTIRRWARRTVGIIAAAIGLTVVSYAIYVAAAWLTYGRRPSGSASGESDRLLDRFMPEYEVVERHHINVNAPAVVTFAALKEMDLEQSPVVRVIFRTRELFMGGAKDRAGRPRGLVELTRALGWGVLAEAPNEIVLGAVTQPWKGEVVFRAVPPDEFVQFREPGYVKIVWNLRAEVLDASHSKALTETRVSTTDSLARAKFRRYWACVSPGVITIRWVAIGAVKRSAERLAQQVISVPSAE